MRPELPTAVAVDNSASIQPARSIFISWGKSVQISGATSWEAIYYMRNRIIHGYVSIDYELVWIVINKDLPELQNQLIAIKT
jgi:uncharacterized protein YutE (UPF0331/DUF86 family)